MINLNRIEVIGNLTRDPELRMTPNNQSITSFSVATNRRYRDNAGQWIDSPPEFHNIIVWGALGERCNQILHKGDRVYVSGRLQSSSWESPDGQKKSKTEIVADSIIGPDTINKNMGGGSEDGGFAPSSSAAPAKSSPKKATAPAADEEINIDDIPF
ncbi:MAG TPA: single-stranded DNA-binding protein [Verrucomicrobiae bacterium]|nr:single-stranded DNA-binding protein [Verrucomicrobiae bacterium]